MNRIKLSDGVIAIGGVGNDAFLLSLKIANYLAINENVAYFSYLSYYEKVHYEIKRMDGTIEKNLIVYDSLKHFNVETFLFFIEKIKAQSINTIIIDDIESFLGNEYNYETIFEERNDSVLNSFLFLSENYDVRVIFNTSVNKFAANPPGLPAFYWNRKMISACNQIYAVTRQYQLGIVEDSDGRSTENDIEVYSLKNEFNKDIKIVLDNKKLNIYQQKENDELF